MTEIAADRKSDRKFGQNAILTGNLVYTPTMKQIAVASLILFAIFAVIDYRDPAPVIAETFGVAWTLLSGIVLSLANGT